MKTRFTLHRWTLLAALALLAAASLPARADMLRDHHITFTGAIHQADDDGTFDNEDRKLPLTIKNILKVLGRTEDPKAVRYYFNETQASYVIAPKGIADGADAEFFVTVLNYNGGAVGWTTKATPKVAASTSALGIQALSFNLAGTTFEAQTSTPRKTHDTGQFIAFGAIAGRDTIVKGTLKLGRRIQ